MAVRPALTINPRFNALPRAPNALEALLEPGEAPEKAIPLGDVGARRQTSAAGLLHDLPRSDCGRGPREIRVDDLRAALDAAVRRAFPTASPDGADAALSTSLRALVGAEPIRDAARAQAILFFKTARHSLAAPDQDPRSGGAGESLTGGAHSGAPAHAAAAARSEKARASARGPDPA